MGLSHRRRDHERVERPADRSGERVAEDPHGGRVELDDPAFVVDRDDRINRVLKDRGLTPLTQGEGCRR